MWEGKGSKGTFHQIIIPWNLYCCTIVLLDENNLNLHRGKGYPRPVPDQTTFGIANQITCL
jgi:hypothetical protein